MLKQLTGEGCSRRIHCGEVNEGCSQSLHISVFRTVLHVEKKM